MQQRKPGKRQRELFLATLAEGLSVSGAARAAGADRRALRRLREMDEDFAQAWDDAVDAGVDALEDAVLRRAKDGVERPVFYQGVQVGVQRSYSDSLAVLLLKARRPERYGDRGELSAGLGLRHEDILDLLD